MRDDLRTKIDQLLSRYRIMTLATVRPDGWPQATTVGFVSEGLTLYFFCSAASQKAANLSHDNRVSLTIDADTKNPLQIEGLSMAARAYPLSDPAEVRRILALMPAKYPEYLDLPQPDLLQVAVYRVEPTVISVLNYTKGFGHSDLVYLNEVEAVA
jgi:nitroimidazol reductase NimA-like FMN-containing flavoprotein (pyridoxamine 5'-phosphate oxidase superfamily)